MDGEPAVYHVISRTALPGFPLGDVEKDYLIQLIRKLSRVYCAEVLGFCVLGNHFHLLVRMHPGSGYSDDEIRQRFQIYYGADTTRELVDGQIPAYRKKWGGACPSTYGRSSKGLPGGTTSGTDAGGLCGASGSRA